jgi:hypothetical protein
MKRLERERRRRRLRAAILFGIVGLIITNLGVLTLLRGRLHYQNYWGGWVFAPFALVVGVLTISYAIRLRKER